MTSKYIGLIGFGDLGQQVSSMLLQEGYSEKSFIIFDDYCKKKNSFKFNEYLDDSHAELEFIVCLGYKHLSLKKSIIKKLTERKRKIFTYIHSTAFINPTAKIGKGVIIYPMCNIDKDVIIEDGVLINNSVVISHNSHIKRATYISPGVIISGNVNIGYECFLGSGTVVSNSITIGNNCRIGIGTIVTRDISHNECVIGNPMRSLGTEFNLK